MSNYFIHSYFTLVAMTATWVAMVLTSVMPQRKNVTINCQIVSQNEANSSDARNSFSYIFWLYPTPCGYFLSSYSETFQNYDSGEKRCYIRIKTRRSNQTSFITICNSYCRYRNSFIVISLIMIQSF